MRGLKRVRELVCAREKRRKKKAIILANRYFPEKEKEKNGDQTSPPHFSLPPRPSSTPYLPPQKTTKKSNRPPPTLTFLQAKMTGGHNFSSPICGQGKENKKEGAMCAIARPEPKHPRRRGLFSRPRRKKK